jgi:hypothetical protein
MPSSHQLALQALGNTASKQTSMTAAARDQEAALISLASSSHQFALEALGNTASKQTSMTAAALDHIGSDRLGVFQAPVCSAGPWQAYKQTNSMCRMQLGVTKKRLRQA